MFFHYPIVFYVLFSDEIPVALNQEVQVTACIVSTEDTPCAIELQAKIINCGTYRVYNLQPPTLCPSAYCFGKDGFINALVRVL